MRKKVTARRDLLDGLSPMDRARELQQDGEPLCERVAGGAVWPAVSEAAARLARGELDEALIWIERAEPRLSGLARFLARVPGLSFGAPAPKRNARDALDRAADRFWRGDIVEAVAQLEAFDGFHGLSRHLTARAGA